MCERFWTPPALAAAPAFAQDRSAQEVVDAHLAAFAAGDVEAVMSDFADDAIVITQQGVLRGHDEIRGLFEALIAEFGQEGAHIDLTQSETVANVAYLVWTGESPEATYPIGTDTIVVRDGLIAVQTLAVLAVPN